MRWITRFFQRPSRSSLSPVPRIEDHVDDETKQAYEADKQAILHKKAEIMARLNRLGYQLEVVTRRDGPDAHH